MSLTTRTTSDVLNTFRDMQLPSFSHNISNGTLFAVLFVIVPNTASMPLSSPSKHFLFRPNVHGDHCLFFSLSVYFSVCPHYFHLPLLVEYRYPLAGFTLFFSNSCSFLSRLALLTFILFHWISLCQHHVHPVSIYTSLFSSIHLQSCLVACKFVDKIATLFNLNFLIQKLHY